MVRRYACCCYLVLRWRLADWRSWQGISGITQIRSLALGRGSLVIVALHPAHASAQLLFPFDGV